MNNSSLGQINNVNDLTHRLASIGTVAVYLLVALAVLYILWSIVQYFIKGNTGDENRHAATMQIVWGIVGLAVIMSLWGLVNIFVNTFVTNSAAPPPPNADFVTPGLSSSNTFSNTISSGGGTCGGVALAADLGANYRCVNGHWQPY